MALFLRMRLTARIPSVARGPIELVALVNSGYQANREEMIFPLDSANRLGWWPSVPAGAIPRRYGSAGDPFEVYVLADAISVQIVTPGGDSRLPIPADAVLSPRTRRPLISDALGSALGIVIIDMRAGLWAFRDEMSVIRQGETPSVA